MLDWEKVQVCKNWRNCCRKGPRSIYHVSSCLLSAADLSKWRILFHLATYISSVLILHSGEVYFASKANLSWQPLPSLVITQSSPWQHKLISLVSDESERTSHIPIIKKWHNTYPISALWTPHVAFCIDVNRLNLLLLACLAFQKELLKAMQSRTILTGSWEALPCVLAVNFNSKHDDGRYDEQERYAFAEETQEMKWY